ncbi:MAG TPA: DUF4139 domain-containing protein [Caulobacteraceae bacterium]|jgi:hypothetical protein|nr:DUF4139 domain-containing protein [Caulobacteraceae bacterium]
MKQLLIAGAWLLAAGSASAQAAPLETPTSTPRLSITIYNNNLALVEDHRTLDVAAGRRRLEFKDVSAQIKPETVAMSGAGLTVAEQNFDYDLLTPEKLMEKAVGHEVQIVRTNPGDGKQTIETATVLSANGGVVLKIGDRIEVLRDDGIPTRVIFNGVPENLRPRPTLSVTVDADRSGPRDVTLSYLTTGLSWKADYVAVFDENRQALDLQGWITLTNTSGTSFNDVDAQLVAGGVDNSLGEGNPYPRFPIRRLTQTLAGSEPSSPSRLGDFYIYPLHERTTVADQQTKQVGFVEAKAVHAQKIYEYRAEGFQSLEQAAHAAVALEFSNAQAKGLGAPMPAGVVRVYLRDAKGEAKFAGEDSIDHTPQGSDLSLKLGEAFDVTVQPTLTAQERHGASRTASSMSYRLRNAGAAPVTIDLRQDGLGLNGKVLRESAPSRRIDADTLGWDVVVPANGETVLTFQVESGS